MFSIIEPIAYLQRMCKTTNQRGRSLCNLMAFHSPQCLLGLDKMALQGFLQFNDLTLQSLQIVMFETPIMRCQVMPC